MAAQAERGIPLSALNPKFLHTNSTSHTWPFSAIAELIDNAYDPDVSAKQFWIDKTAIRDQDCLIFMDNGAGMDYDKMFKMLSFGFSDKKTKNGHVPVGLYGNGFKSGSMRLGKDAIVFSKNKESMCVGMLSQTYLQEIHAENVIVPIVSFRRIGHSIQPESQHAASLQDILRYSLFQTEEELHCELNAISAHYATEATGTRIIIWNLRKTSSDKSEFDFDTDRYDIQIPSEVYESEKEKYKQPSRIYQSSPESDFSLQAYCSILYLKPKMHIIIRGQKVKTQLISKSLAHIVKDKYKPSFLDRESIPITFGYNTKSKEHYGVMMYHKNRLIKAYERVGCQNRATGKGVGVIAVIECNFLKPTHNKQDFDYTEDYRRTMSALGQKLEEYWKAIRHKKGAETPVPMEDIPKCPDQNWVQCDECMKWRKLPDGINMNKLPEKWFCRMNPNPQYRHCDAAEEAEDSADESSICLKEYKEHEKKVKKQQEQRRIQENARLRQEQQKHKELIEQNAHLKTRPLSLVHQLIQKPPSSPKSPTVSGTATIPLDSESASSPSGSVPVISNVISLSTPKRIKRSIELSSNQAAKRTRIFPENCGNTPNSPSTSAATSDVRSPSLLEDFSDNNVDENNAESSGDEDIVIDETKSTPRPSTFDLCKVKTEKSTSDKAIGLYMECSDLVSMENETEDTRNETMETSTNDQISIMTQTDRLTIKCEEDQQLRQEDRKIKSEETGDDARMMEQSTTEVQSKMSKDAEINKDNVEIKEKSSLNVSRPNLAKAQGIPTENDIGLEQHAKSEVENQEGMTSTTSRTSLLSDKEISLLPTIEAQTQQDNLLELLEATAQERDKFKAEVLEKEIKLLALTLKKDCSHQSVQTDPSEEERYKTLYLQAKQCIQKITEERDELKKDQAFQIKVEKEAQDKLASLEQERASYLQLQKEVEELRKQKEEWSKAKAEKETQNHANTNSEQTCSTSTAPNLANEIRNEGESSEKPADGENAAKLRELRFSVAQLLINFVPALDLNQVNYDCEVIDEILNQVIQDIPPL